MTDQWTPRVTARAELAELFLREPHRARATGAGLTEADLEALRARGREAEAADRRQQEELAAISAARGGRRIAAAELYARERDLRDRLAAVIGELEDAGDPLARFLARLSFARYRFRELEPAPASNDAEGDELRAVERVERRDALTRLSGLAAFCAAILRPGREAIVARLEARGFRADALRALHDDAEAYVAAGRNAPKGAASTAVEAQAAAAQSVTWRRVRRMVRNAVRGEPELEAKYAEC